MQIDIQSRDFSLTESLLGYARKRLIYAMAYCSGHIKRVVVRLSDINGQHGGADKRCHIQVVLAGIPDVVIEDTHVDLYSAIDHAIARAKRTVVRKVDRQLTPDII